MKMPPIASPGAPAMSLMRVPVHSQSHRGGCELINGGEGAVRKTLAMPCHRVGRAQKGRGAIASRPLVVALALPHMTMPDASSLEVIGMLLLAKSPKA